MPELRDVAEPQGPSSTWTEVAQRCDVCGEIRTGYERPDAAVRTPRLSAPDGDGERFPAARLDDEALAWDRVPPVLAGADGYEVGVYLFRCLDCGTHVVRWDAA